MNKQRADVSALLDDELEDHAVATVLEATLQEPALQDAWQTYVMIGDELRGDSLPSADMTACVMARIREEPVVLAPRRLRTRPDHHPLLALAASVAGVAVVGWLALSGTGSSPVMEHRFAAVSRASTFAKAPVPSTDAGQTVPPPQMVAIPQDVKEYMLAHQTHSSSLRFAHGADNIRTVSFAGNQTRP